jgi:hypothetical protein
MSGNLGRMGGRRLNPQDGVHFISGPRTHGRLVWPVRTCLNTEQVTFLRAKKVRMKVRMTQMIADVAECIFR